MTLTGPRQSGKTTLVKACFASHQYVSLEEPDSRSFALEDPRGFLGQFQEGVVLDEVQRTPDLFSYIQTLVDDDPRPGRFVLSGSQNFLLLRSVGQSLAGRSTVLHLLPLSLSELARRPTLDPDRLEIELVEDRSEWDQPLMETLFRGFYPRLQTAGLDATTWLADYYQTYIERDVREIVNVGDLDAFGRFIRLCAGRNGQLLNLSSLANDCGITHTTARRWLSILEASFVVRLLRPHHANFSKRLIKSPKLYFLDSGLLCYLLRIRAAQDLETHGSRGPVFETFVFAELAKSFLNHGREIDLYFWRTSGGREVDFLLQRGEELLAIEAKSGQTVASDFFSSLLYWRDLHGHDDWPALLVTAGDRTFRQRGVDVISWRRL